MAVKKVTGTTKADKVEPTKTSSANAKAGKKAEESDAQDVDFNNDDIDIEEASLAKPGAKLAGAKKATTTDPDDEDDDDGAEEEDEKDEWEKGDEEEDSWDPDFDEFDLPKSSAKKTARGKKDDGEEEDDFKLDEGMDEFDDLFGGKGGGFDDDDDY
jgi:nucleolin